MQCIKEGCRGILQPSEVECEFKGQHNDHDMQDNENELRSRIQLRLPQASYGYLKCKSHAHSALLGTEFMRRLRYHALRHLHAPERLAVPLSQAGIACSPSRQPSLFASFSSHEIITPCGRPCLILKIASSTGNLLQLHLLRELLVKLTELLDQILACIDNCLLWSNLAVGLHTELEGREKWVRNLVAGEEDVVCLG